tara:strand:+ start:3069 stop:3722 length:654 start_codon:yes stop_codon:yes gene_type:complete
LITLFGNLESGNVHKVQLILRYINEAFVRVDVSQTRGETSQPEFLKLNPIGKIPAVLLDDGDALSESNAILFYFGSTTDLWPGNARSQAEVLRWLFFEQYSHEPTLSVIRYLKNYSEDPSQHQEQIKILEPKAKRALETLEQRLKSQSWVAAEYCTIADYALYPYSKFSDEAGFELAKYPSIQNWLLRVESQPGFLPVKEEGSVQTLSFSDYFNKNI